MIVKDDYTRRDWIYFLLSNTSNAATAFKQFLVGVRANGFPSTVQIVRSGNGVGLFGSAFKSVCDELLVAASPARHYQFLKST